MKNLMVYKPFEPNLPNKITEVHWGGEEYLVLTFSVPPKEATLVNDKYLYLCLTEMSVALKESYNYALGVGQYENSLYPPANYSPDDPYQDHPYTIDIPRKDRMKDALISSSSAATEYSDNPSFSNITLDDNNRASSSPYSYTTWSLDAVPPSEYPERWSFSYAGYPPKAVWLCTRDEGGGPGGNLASEKTANWRTEHNAETYIPVGNLVYIATYTSPGGVPYQGRGRRGGEVHFIVNLKYVKKNLGGKVTFLAQAMSGSPSTGTIKVRHYKNAKVDGFSLNPANGVLTGNENEIKSTKILTYNVINTGFDSCDNFLSLAIDLAKSPLYVISQPAVIYPV